MTPHLYVKTRTTRTSVQQQDVTQIETLETRVGRPSPRDVLKGERRGELAPDIVGESAPRVN